MRKARSCIFAGLIALSLGLISVSLAETAATTNALLIDTAAIIKKACPALAVLISVNRPGQAKSFGTGFFISEDGILVTARHVAQAQDKLIAITPDGKSHPVDGFIGDDPDHDIAVLKVEGHGFAHLPLAAALPGPNQRVAVLSPTDRWAALFDRTNAVPPVCSTGQVSSLMDLPGLWTTILTTISAQRGQSGSPLLNERGEVVGVVPHIDAQEQANASPAAIIRQIQSSSHGNSPLPFAKRPRTVNSAPLAFDKNFRSGVEAMGRNASRDAKHRMKRAAKDFPQSAVPLTCLAVICAAQESWKETHTYCQKALQLSPNCGLIHVLDGTSLLSLNQAHTAVAAITRGLELGLPDNRTRTMAWTILAAGETALGHKARAQEALNQLQHLNPEAAASLRDKLQYINKAFIKPGLEKRD